MPKITITEVDLTSPGLINESSNVVYVPGCSTKTPDWAEEANVASAHRLYTDLSSFTSDFGDKVPLIKVSSSDTAKYPNFDDDNDSTNGAYSFDSGYIYASELLRLGIPVLYHWVGISVPGSEKSMSGEQGIETIITKGLGEDALKDPGLYSIKFVSNGGYVSKAINGKVWDLAIARKDCVALIDIPFTMKTEALLDGGSKISSGFIKDNVLSSYSNVDGKYAALFAPWGIYSPTCIQGYHRIDNNGYATDTDGSYTYYPSRVELPGSFGYLMALASALKSGANNWVAMAGATRGQIPFLIGLKEEFTESDIEKYQTRKSISINPIATINPFGMIVWGNRTMYDNALKGNLIASSFLNIRNLCSDVKKTVWTTSRRLTFEQNSDILWVNFKSYITPILDQMVTGGCLSGYELKKRANKQKAELRAVVRLYPIEAVEDFDIELQLADESTAIIE